jgi:hypothetical protein
MTAFSFALHLVKDCSRFDNAVHCVLPDTVGEYTEVIRSLTLEVVTGQ